MRPSPRSVEPRQFLIVSPAVGEGAAIRRRQLDQQKSLFFAFIESYLLLNETGYQVCGLQSGFGFGEDQILLLADGGGSLCVPVSILLEPEIIAREIVKTKIEKFKSSFSKSRLVRRGTWAQVRGRLGREGESSLYKRLERTGMDRNG